MFLGVYSHSIDAKGRLIVPAKFRQGLGDIFYIVKGTDHNIFLYPNEEWEVFVSKLRKLPDGNKNARALKRFYLASAFEVEVDKQGRILIPQIHRDYAEIDKEVVLNGVDNRVEIWSKEIWDSSSLDSEAVGTISDEFADILG